MQPTIVNSCRIGGEDRSLHQRMTRVGETPMERDLNYVSEVKLNFMGCRCIEESIERLLRCGFDIFDNTDDLVNRSLVDQTARSIDEQTNVFVKLNFRWKFH